MVESARIEISPPKDPAEVTPRAAWCYQYRFQGFGVEGWGLGFRVKGLGLRG